MTETVCSANQWTGFYKTASVMKEFMILWIFHIWLISTIEQLILQGMQYIVESPPLWNPPWRGEGAYLRCFGQSVKKESSSERRNYVRAERTDLLYANAKDLLQSGRIYIKVASLSLVSFRHLSVLARGRLISYININYKHKHNRISRSKGVFLFYNFLNFKEAHILSILVFLAILLSWWVFLT